MWVRLFLSLLLILVGADVGAEATPALTVMELQRLMRSAPMRETRFREIRESPWLDNPVETRGTLVSSPGMLEKRVEFPKAETWRILPDRVEWVDAEGSKRKQLPLGDAPALASLASALRRVASGDLLALDQDFLVEVRGNSGLWVVRLTPRLPAVARHLQQMELQGAGARVRAILIAERSGERTTIYLLE